MFTNLRHQAATSLKQLIYGRRGEPYQIGPRRARYIDQDTEIGSTAKYGTMVLEKRR